jgi:hypothetical protein
LELEELVEHLEMVVKEVDYLELMVDIVKYLIQLLLEVDKAKEKKIVLPQQVLEDLVEVKVETMHLRLALELQAKVMVVGLMLVDVVVEVVELPHQVVWLMMEFQVELVEME